MSTATATIRYRKTSKGEWVAFGPASALRIGSVTVTKSDGTTKTEYVEKLGKTFQAGGTDCCYGYLRKTAASHAPAGARKCRACGGNAHKCDECGERWPVTEAVDMSGLGGCVCGICDRSGGLSFA